MKRATAFVCGVVLWACVGAAAAKPRLVEAWAPAPVDPHVVMRIAPGSTTQAGDPIYIDIANRLGNLMANEGYNVVGREKDPDVFILIDYVAQMMPYQPFDRPTLNDPVYRALVVTAIDAHAPHGPSDIPKVVWQTVVDSYGGDSNLTHVIPQLVDYGGPYYAKMLTPQGLGPARWCADRIPTTGSLLKPNCPLRPGLPPPPPTHTIIGAG